MHENTEFTLSRDTESIQIPSGNKITIPAGTTGVITQTLGGSYTIATSQGLSRIAEKDLDALGIDKPQPTNGSDSAIAPAPVGEVDDKAVWDQLRQCYDPEIPVNIVDLGLVYDCQLKQERKRRDESGSEDDADRARLRHGPGDRARCAEQNYEHRRRGRSASRSRLGSALEPEHDQRSRADEARDGLRRETPRISEATSNNFERALTAIAPRPIIGLPRCTARRAIFSTSCLPPKSFSPKTSPDSAPKPMSSKCAAVLRAIFSCPQGKAYEVTKSSMRKLDMLKAKRAEREAKELNEAEETARRIGKSKMVFTLETGETGKAFGSVTANDIATRLKNEIGVEIDRHRLVLEHPIKSTGEHEISIKLHHDVTATLKFTVKSASEPKPEANEATEAEARGLVLPRKRDTK